MAAGPQTIAAPMQTAKRGKEEEDEEGKWTIATTSFLFKIFLGNSLRMNMQLSRTISHGYFHGEYSQPFQ